MSPGVASPGESAHRFPVGDARRRPGRGRPHSQGARASRSAPFLSPPRFSPFALVFPRADVFPRSTGLLGSQGPAVSFGFRDQACDDLDSPKPTVAPELLAAPAGPWGGGPSRQAVRLGLRAPEEALCLRGMGS